MLMIKVQIMMGQIEEYKKFETEKFSFMIVKNLVFLITKLHNKIKDIGKKLLKMLTDISM